MIKLDVAEYCHDCPDFEPKIDKNVIHDGNGEHRIIGNMYVVCKRYRICHRFMTYLKSRLTKEKGENDGRKV